MINHSALSQGWQSLTSIGVFLFFALTFGIPSGYSYGAAFLLLVSLAFLITRPSLRPSTEDKALVYLLLAFFLVSLLAFFVHGNAPKTLDQSSRYLLFVPVLFLILRIAPASPMLWGGLLIGVGSALLLALWQRLALGNFRPDGYMTSAIPFGNLSLMAGILCLTGITWAGSQARYAVLWKIALCAGFVAGLYVSLLSGSRGGWLTIPVVLIIFFVAFFKKSKLKPVVIGAPLLLAVVVAVGASMQHQIMDRYEAAMTELNEYVANQNSSTSVGIRLEAWRAAIVNISEKPLLGWSHKDYDARLKEMAAHNKANASITSLANTHNNFLEIWVHQGLLGLLAFLALFIVPFWFFCKRLRSKDPTVQAFALGGACLLACFFIFGLTQVILGRNNGVIFFGLTLIIFWGSMRNAEQRISG
jgi:O-antigen ligase